jgi:D-mannonate dehydratase
MKAKAICLLILILGAGLATFYLTRSKRMESAAAPYNTLPELAWIRTDLGLTEPQYAKVADLHVSYSPECMKMCRQIAEAREKVEMLAKNSRALTPEYDAALGELAAVQLKCRRAMLKHIYATAALLDEAQSVKYLKMVLPHALGSSQIEHGKSMSESP